MNYILISYLILSTNYFDQYSLCYYYYLNSILNFYCLIKCTLAGYNSLNRFKIFSYLFIFLFNFYYFNYYLSVNLYLNSIIIIYLQNLLLGFFFCWKNFIKIQNSYFLDYNNKDCYFFQMENIFYLKAITIIINYYFLDLFIFQKNLIVIMIIINQYYY